jgi:hypothetical protein
MLADRRQAWDLRPDGSYVQRQPPAEGGPAALGAQQVLMELTRQRAERGEPAVGGYEQRHPGPANQLQAER